LEFDSVGSPYGSKKSFADESMGETLNEQLAPYDLFQRSAITNPNRIAVIEAERKVTYGELRNEVMILAGRLSAQGVTAAQPICVCLPRSLSSIVAQLAIASLGAVYLPLDHEQPTQRALKITRASGAQIVITDEQSSNKFLDLEAVLSSTGEVMISRKKRGPTFLPGEVQYIVFTSGTTGTPKGVLVTKQNVTALIAAVQRELDVEATDVWTWYHSPAFDFSILEVWMPLVSGGTVAIIPSDSGASPAALVERIAAGATIACVTPFLLNHLLGEVSTFSEELRSATFSSLRYLISSGDLLSNASVALWNRAPLGRAKLINAFGASETTVINSAREVSADTNRTFGFASIGHSLDDSIFAVVDATMSVVPSGIPGELVISGPCVALGYLDQTETKRRFQEGSPCFAGGRYYRTGDRAVQLEDGTFEITGRIDRQILLGGYRIELGDIEANLRQLSEVIDAAAVLDQSGSSEVIVAFVVPSESDTLTSDRVRSLLATKLPSYMLPTNILLISQLPLTSGNKIDYAELLRKASVRRDPKVDSVSVGNPEQDLEFVWTNLLAPESMVHNSNFFELGGNSMLALELVAGLESYGWKLQLSDVLRHPTFGEMLQKLDRYEKDASSVARKEDLPPSDAMPLVGLQEGLLYAAMLDPEHRAYCAITKYSLRVEQEVTQKSFATAWNQLLLRHETLRMHLQLVDGNAFLGEGLSDDQQLVCETDENAARLVAQALIGNDMSWRSVQGVGAINDNEVTLFLVYPHYLLDGWSVNLLGREFKNLVVGMTELPEVSSGALTRYARLIRAVETDERSAAYWESRVQALVSGDLPWCPRGEPASTYCYLFSSAIQGALGRASRKCNAPVKSILLAVFLRVLSILSDGELHYTHLIVGTRGLAGIGTDCVGLFLNMLPFGVNSSDLTWSEFVDAVRLQEAEDLEYSLYPWTRITNGQVLSPLRTSFNYVDFPQDYDSDLYVESSMSGDIPLVLIASPDKFIVDGRGGGLSSLEERTVARLFRQVLENALTDLDRCDHTMIQNSASVSLVGPLESQGRGDTIVKTFWSNATKSPVATAVCCGQTEVTYSKLWETSSKLFCWLRANNIGSGNRVLVFCNHDVDLLAAFLAIWRAGASVVPIDPGEVRGRVRRIMVDVHASACFVGCGLKVPLAIDHGLVLGDIDEILRRDAPLDEASDEDLSHSRGEAYVMFTSGSTGFPKAVTVTHQSLSSRLASYDDIFGSNLVGAIVHTSIGFDPSLIELFWPALRTGYCIMPTQALAEPARLLSLIQFAGQALVQGTPTLLAGALELGWNSHVGEILVGGEHVGRALVNDLGFRCDRVLVGYGPTETTIWSSIGSPESEGPVSIGQPVANTSFILRTRSGTVAPVGGLGEICILGDGNSPVAMRSGTDQDLDDLFVRQSCYRTGDLARVLADGRMVFLGRSDGQRKIRGYRVDLAEIEVTMRTVPGIVDSACEFVRLPEFDEDVLAGFYVVGKATTTESIRSVLLDKLPFYMMPRTLREVAQIPRTGSGKLDRKLLTSQVQEHSAAINAIQSVLSDEIEISLAEAWMSVTDAKYVSGSDNFLSLGGDSIKAMKVAIFLDDTLGVLANPGLFLTGDSLTVTAAVLRAGAFAKLPSIAVG